MKYLLILFISLASNLALASYHGGDGGDGSTGSSDSGYGSGGSAAAALVGVGLIAYFVINRDSDEAEAEFNTNTDRNRFEIDFLQDDSKFAGLSEDFAGRNKFQINFKYNIN
tara:strand:- start:1163 stop:1498 length:336 start_codon:yes stop_codon:yes gene_type:complete